MGLSGLPLQGEDFQEEALVFTFGLALVLLRREDVQPSFFSSRNLESRDKKQGWMTMTFLKFLLVSYSQSRQGNMSDIIEYRVWPDQAFLRAILLQGAVCG